MAAAGTRGSGGQVRPPLHVTSGLFGVAFAQVLGWCAVLAYAVSRAFEHDGEGWYWLVPAMVVFTWVSVRPLSRRLGCSVSSQASQVGARPECHSKQWWPSCLSTRGMAMSSGTAPLYSLPKWSWVPWPKGFMFLVRGCSERHCAGCGKLAASPRTLEKAKWH